MKNLLLVIFAMLVLAGCSKKESAENNDILEISLPGGKEIMINTTEQLEKGKTYFANIQTNMGNIEIELFADKTPKTVRSFVLLAKSGYYDGITFHRVIDRFMIQGGDPTGTGSGGTSIYGEKFEDEFRPELKHTSEGILSMANAGPNTNGSQFFITLVPTPHLDGKHTVFGKVTKGIEVVRAIGKVKTSKPGDKPIEPVVMQKVTVDAR